MLILRKVAVTGGLSAGKSTVCRLLKELGAYTVSADEIVHQLLTPNTKIGQQVILLLGKEILRENCIDRAEMGKKVFGKEKTLKSLEQILHPAVLEEIDKQYNQVKEKQKYTLFVAEIPLLYESESHKYFDATVAVVTKQDIAKMRFGERDSKSDEEYEKRMTHQLSPEEKRAKADFTLVNNTNLEDLKKQVDHLIEQLTPTKNK